MGLIGQTLLVELKENPLRPAVVFTCMGRDFPIPVVAETQTFDLLSEVLDVLLCGYLGMGACLDRIVLSR